MKMASAKAVMDLGRIREIAEEAKLRGIALECNTGCHWRYAHPDFGLSDLWLTLLAEVGNRVVTASDAHDPADVNRDLEQARARLIQFGVRCA